MARSKDAEGNWFEHPPYTEREQDEFEALLRRGGDITIVRGSPRDRPPPSPEDRDEVRR